MGGLGYAKNIVVLGFSDDTQLGRLRLVSGACRACRPSRSGRRNRPSRPPGTPWTSGTPGTSWKSPITVRPAQLAASSMSWRVSAIRQGGLGRSGVPASPAHLRCWRSCWLPEHDLTARRDHLADRAPANNEEHRDPCRHQGQLEGQRRHRPMNVSDLGEDCEASKNSDMILKRNLAFAACQHAQVEAIYNRFNDANSNDALDAKQYDRRIESDKASNRQGDANPGCRLGPPQCTYNGVCRLFSGL